MMMTPFSVVMTLPGSVSAQLLPKSDAPISTMTEPGIMVETASAVSNSGAGRPGTCAVVITISLFEAWCMYTSWVRA